MNGVFSGSLPNGSKDQIYINTFYCRCDSPLWASARLNRSGRQCGLKKVQLGPGKIWKRVNQTRGLGLPCFNPVSHRP